MVEKTLLCRVSEMLAFMVAGALMAVTSEPTDADVATLAGKKPGYWINLDGKTYHGAQNTEGG